MFPPSIVLGDLIFAHFVQALSLILEDGLPFGPRQQLVVHANHVPAGKRALRVICFALVPLVPCDHIAGLARSPGAHNEARHVVGLFVGTICDVFLE